MRRKLITRTTVVLCMLLVVAVVYLLFFRVTTKQAYYCVSESYSQESHTGVVCDGEYLYNYNYSTGIRSNKRIADTLNSESSLSIVASNKDTTISKVDSLPSTYQCSLDAVSWYVNTLLDEGYVIDSYETDSNHIDYLLHSKAYTIRVVWIKDNYCHIFCLDSGKKYTNPPYING